jgi:hypothetical protein
LNFLSATARPLNRFRRHTGAVRATSSLELIAQDRWRVHQRVLQLLDRSPEQRRRLQDLRANEWASL